MRFVIINHILKAKKKFRIPLPDEVTPSEPRRKDKLGLIFALIFVTVILAVVAFS
jgi:hypothetical protein